MEVITWKKNAKNRESGFIVRVNKKQALQLIVSLSSQLLSNSPNNGRIEFVTKKNEYFSISINEPDVE
jgi:hypothetical protein